MRLTRKEINARALEGQGGGSVERLGHSSVVAVKDSPLPADILSWNPSQVSMAVSSLENGNGNFTSDKGPFSLVDIETTMAEAPQEVREAVEEALPELQEKINAIEDDLSSHKARKRLKRAIKSITSRIPKEVALPVSGVLIALTVAACAKGDKAPDIVLVTAPTAANTAEVADGGSGEQEGLDLADVVPTPVVNVVNGGGEVESFSGEGVGGEIPVEVRNSAVYQAVDVDMESLRVELSTGDSPAIAYDGVQPEIWVTGDGEKAIGFLEIIAPGDTNVGGWITRALPGEAGSLFFLIPDGASSLSYNFEAGQVEAVNEAGQMVAFRTYSVDADGYHLGDEWVSVPQVVDSYIYNRNLNTNRLAEYPFAPPANFESQYQWDGRFGTYIREVNGVTQAYFGNIDSPLVEGDGWADLMDTVETDFGPMNLLVANQMPNPNRYLVDEPTPPRWGATSTRENMSQGMERVILEALMEGMNMSEEDARSRLVSGEPIPITLPLDFVQVLKTRTVAPENTITLMWDIRAGVNVVVIPDFPFSQTEFFDAPSSMSSQYRGIQSTELVEQDDGSLIVGTMRGYNVSADGKLTIFVLNSDIYFRVTEEMAPGSDQVGSFADPDYLDLGRDLLEALYVLRSHVGENRQLREYYRVDGSSNQVTWPLAYAFGSRALDSDGEFDGYPLDSLLRSS